MSTEPFFGRAVHAPIVSAPKATPRVSVSQVAPSPIAAAKTNVRREAKNSRTFDPIQIKICYGAATTMPAAQSPREILPA